MNEIYKYDAWVSPLSFKIKYFFKYKLKEYIYIYKNSYIFISIYQSAVYMFVIYMNMQNKFSSIYYLVFFFNFSKFFFFVFSIFIYIYILYIIKYHGVFFNFLVFIVFVLIFLKW